ncbi:MAG: hypothetical protein ABIQ39_03230, partial [Ilumatobacteraceae bacterium]
MTDQLLNIFKYALLALLYLFFARVLWAVWSEVRGPRRGKAQAATMAYQADPRATAAPGDLTVATQLPSVVTPQRSRGKRGAVTKLVITN